MIERAVDGVQSALSSLIGAISASYERLLGFAHYVAVIRAEPDLPVATAGGLPGLAQGIELRDVWFRYSDDHPWVLAGMNLKIPRGRPSPWSA